MDAMSDAIEGADVMLYGVSLAYKESANVSASSSPAVWCDACSCSCQQALCYRIRYGRCPTTRPGATNFRSSMGLQLLLQPLLWRRQWLLLGLLQWRRRRLCHALRV